MYCLISPFQHIEYDPVSDDMQMRTADYRGFFGCHYFTEQLSDLPILLGIKSKSDYVIKVTHINRLKEAITIDSHNFKLIGYDVGLVEADGEFVFYSLIPNELSSCGYTYTKPFLKILNKYGLFDDKEHALCLIKKREYLLSIGESFGIETFYDDCSVLNVYAIYFVLV